MSIRLIGKYKFQIVNSVDAYIHKAYMYSIGSFFCLSVSGKEEAVPIAFGKETFLNKIHEFNPNNETIFVTKEDFEEIRSFLNDPEEYLKELEKLNEGKTLINKEEKIMSERTPEEDYEAQIQNYNPEFDNFNLDDCDSTYYDPD